MVIFGHEGMLMGVNDYGRRQSPAAASAPKDQR